MSRRSNVPPQKTVKTAAKSGAADSAGPSGPPQSPKPGAKIPKSDAILESLFAAGDLSRFAMPDENCSPVCDSSSPENSANSPGNTETVSTRSEPTSQDVPAIQAAVQILSQNQGTSTARSNDASAIAPAARPRGDQTQSRGADAVAVLRNEMRTLGSTLRDEFRQSISELQSAQAAAITAQSEVLRTLTEMIYQSSASQASHEISAETLERVFCGIEQRLLEKLEDVASGHAPASHHALENNEKRSSSATTPRDASARETSGAVKQQKAASSVNRSWEQIRSEMFSTGELCDTPEEDSQKAADKLPEVTQLTSDRHFRLPEQDPSLEIPTAVDPESLSDQELRDAFRARETFITTLIARIRRQQELATGQLSPDQLRTLVNDLPEELATQVRHTLLQMEALARMGELELSLERARIARQVNQLEHSRMTIERNARQLGMELNPDGTLSIPTARPGRGSSGRRWLGKLGFGQ